MIEIKDKGACSGCGACAAGCPHEAIQMKADDEGFLYPVISWDCCVRCGLCLRICPVINKRQGGDQKPLAFVVKALDEEVRMASASGGFFTPLAEYIIEQGGLICAADYDQDFKVVHRITGHKQALARMRGSKYVQSDICGSYRSIRETLEKGGILAFFGTPCQVYGLKAYLNKEYESLITVEVVCHGTPSPKLWKKYVDYQQERWGSRIKAVNFRNKTYGYHSGTMKLEFENGKNYYGSARVDYMLKSFFQEISSRPSCYCCPFKEEGRISDFSLFDSWNAAILAPGVRDDDRGFTNVAVHSDKGAAILEELKKVLFVRPVDYGEAVKLDGSMVHESAVPHSRRAEFYKDLDEEPLPFHISRFIPVTPKDRLIEAAKRIVYKAGILNYVKLLVKK